MAKNPRNREGVFLNPLMTACSAIGAIGKVVVGDFDFRRKGSEPLTLLHSPLTPTTDRENVGVNPVAGERGTQSVQTVPTRFANR